ncbi:MAG: GntR family transcriptional regulator [Firmicutes bacterium]|jgi:DNA-binding transcriptional regulator YhcF (GntR family)|nr:GntR family transcriptional regulator [Bacillota bacterium]
MLVDPELEWPLHQQLAAQLQAAIEDGEYHEGERLPSVRELAAMLRLHRNTIVHAYQMLEYAGYARSEPGRGYFAVMPIRGSLPQAHLHAQLQEELSRLHEHITQVTHEVVQTVQAQKVQGEAHDREVLQTIRETLHERRRRRRLWWLWR